jgi:hypothetical protein
MTTGPGRATVSYMVKCALNSGDTLVKQDQNGVNYTFQGGIGLCPDWKTNPIMHPTPTQADWRCQEYVSACMMAHLNTAGVHIPIWIDADPQYIPTGRSTTPIGWGLSASYPLQEGTFFGNILTTGNFNHGSAMAPTGYFCEGDGFGGGSAGVVAGRIGVGMPNAPYVNAYGDGVLCKANNFANCTPQYSAGTAPNSDGYSTCRVNGDPYNNAITVWRAATFTPAFEPSYRFALSSFYTRTSPKWVDTGTGATGTVVTQQTDVGADSHRFAIVANGSYWKIELKANTSRCLDAGAGANTTQITVQTCNGSAQQNWTFVPENTYGTFFVKAQNTGRCMQLSQNSTNAGVAFQMYDCNTWSSERFTVRAY